MNTMDSHYSLLKQHTSFRALVTINDEVHCSFDTTSHTVVSINYDVTNSEGVKMSYYLM